jgi:Prokaryotic E2 family E
MSFLPENDQDFLDDTGIKYKLLVEKMPDGTERNGVLFPDFSFTGNLRTLKDGVLVQCAICDLLVLIPKGYSTTKLDSFYTLPWLKRPDGVDPVNANNATPLFEKSWQFWSRHLDDADWRPGKDDLRMFLSYIRNELRIA